MNIYHLILAGVIAYFIGNISPAILIGKMYGIDIRKEGSGNAGTTNVLRVLGVKAALTTLAIDVFKGWIAVIIGLSLNSGELAAMICFVCVVYGHIFPVVYHFKGGKGVATSLGAAFALDWVSAFALILIAVAMTAITRRMSVGSITAAAAYPFLILYYYPEALPVAILMAATVIFMHRENIRRLMHGEEPKLSFGKKKADAVSKGSEVNSSDSPDLSDLSGSADNTAEPSQTTNNSILPDSNAVPGDPGNRMKDPEEVTEGEEECNIIEEILDAEVDAAAGEEKGSDIIE